MARRQQSCPACGGSGINIADGRDCWKCHGSCAIWVEAPDAPRRQRAVPAGHSRRAPSSGGSVATVGKVVLLVLAIGGILNVLDDDDASRTAAPAAQAAPASQVAQLQDRPVAGNGSLSGRACRVNERAERHADMVSYADRGDWLARKSIGSPSEQQEALGWLASQSEAGNALAQTNLAFLHCFGLGGATHDPVRAAYWLGQAAHQGNVTAQYLLGALLVEGSEGVQRDRQGGIGWLRRAASQGHASAQATLENLGS